MKKKIIQYLGCLCFAIAAFFMVAISKDLFKQTEGDKIFAIICDGLFVPGILMLSVGTLSWIAKMGTFDMLGYGFKSLHYLFSPSKRALEGKQTFFDYVEAKNEKGRVWLPFLLVSGGIVTAISIVLTIIYSCIF